MEENSSHKEKQMKLENTMKFVERWGSYQKRLSFLLVMSTIPGGWLTVFMIFTSATPPHTCMSTMDGREVAKEIVNTPATGNEVNSSESNVTEIMNVATTDFSLVLDQCTMSSGSNSTGNVSVVQCTHGWVYDLDDGKTTAVSEWNLVCDKAWVKPFMTTFWIYGGITASFIVGWVSDRYGRKVILLSSLFGEMIASFLCGLSVNPAMYGATFFFIGMFNTVQFSIAIVIVSEMLAPRERTIVGNLLMAGYAVGYMILPLFTYIAPTWRWLMFICAFPIVLFIPYICLIPESVRWLMQDGQTDEAKKLVLKIVKYNKIVESGTSLNENIPELENFSLEEKKEDSTFKGGKEGRYADLFRSANIRRRLLICFYCWFILSAGYFFFALNTSNLGENEYLNCFISAFLEIPACLLSLVLMKYLGRRKSYVTLMILSALAIGTSPFAILWNETIGIAIAMFGKFVQTAAYDVMFLFTPELFPTMLRAKAMFASVMIGKIGLVISPYIVYFGENVTMALPYLIIAPLTGLSALLALLLPETKDSEVPNTLDEAERLK